MTTGSAKTLLLQDRQGQEWNASRTAIERPRRTAKEAGSREHWPRLLARKAAWKCTGRLPRTMMYDIEMTELDKYKR